MANTYRIRRCTGNQDAFFLVPLRDDGSEIEMFLSGSTAFSLDALIERNRETLAGPDTRVELHPSVFAAA